MTKLLGVMFVAVAALTELGCGSEREPKNDGPHAFALTPHASGPKRVALASGGAALMPVVISAQASVATIEAATELARRLSAIASASFVVETGDGTTGIAVGGVGDFPGVFPSYPGDASDVENQDGFLVRTHAAGVHLVGVGEIGVRNAVWMTLRHLGYRQFFPSPKWEYVPARPNLSLALDVTRKPAYTLRGWGGGNVSPYNERNDDWNRKNGFESSVSITTGHAYQAIRLDAEYAQAFADHPEYLSPGNKLCVYEPGLQDIAYDFVSEKFAAFPTRKGTSLTPNDGLGDWTCASDPPGVSTSDKALYLANTVADRLAQSAEYPNKVIGMLAYGDTSPPPTTYAVSSGVKIFPAMGFIQEGLDFESVARGWYDAGARQMGFYNYYSVIVWGWDQPGTGHISKTHQWLDELVYYKNQYDFQYTWGESSDAWGPFGLQYWLYAGAAWDPEKAQEESGGEETLERRKQDFFAKAFGSAASALEDFYALIDGEPSPPLLSTDLVGRMYGLLRDGKAATSDPAVLARIDDLVLYARYVELYHRLKLAQQADTGVEQRLIDYLKHVKRMRDTQMVYYWGLFSAWKMLIPASKPDIITNVLAELGVSDISVWNADQVFPEPDYTAPEIQAFLDAGVANNPILTWAPVSFSKNLVVPRIPLNVVSKGAVTTWLSGDQDLYVEPGPLLAFTLTARAGMSSSAYGGARCELSNATTGEVVFSQDLVADKVARDLVIAVPVAGLYHLTLRNNQGGTDLDWAADLRIVKAIPDNPDDLGMPTTASYFFVPAGTTVLGGYSDWASGKLYDPDGVEIPIPGPDYFSVPVDPAKAGRLWKFKTCYRCSVLTVPPYFGLSDKQMLIPAEVAP